MDGEDWVPNVRKLDTGHHTELGDYHCLLCGEVLRRVVRSAPQKHIRRQHGTSMRLERPITERGMSSVTTNYTQVGLVVRGAVAQGPLRSSS